MSENFLQQYLMSIDLSFIPEDILTDEIIESAQRPIIYPYDNSLEDKILQDYFNLSEQAYLMKKLGEYKSNYSHLELLLLSKAGKLYKDKRFDVAENIYKFLVEDYGSKLFQVVDQLFKIYKKMKNQAYQEWLLEARDSFGNISMEKTNIVKPLVRNIKKGMACGLLIDTNINPKEGLMVEFMGKSIRQTSTPAYLARKFNAAIIPVTIRTDDEENYTLMLFDEIPVERTDDVAADIAKATQLQADWLTKLITNEPKFWFWLHRRWKNDHPKIYKK